MNFLHNDRSILYEDGTLVRDVLIIERFVVDLIKNYAYLCCVVNSFRLRCKSFLSLSISSGETSLFGINGYRYFRWKLMCKNEDR